MRRQYQDYSVNQSYANDIVDDAALNRPKNNLSHNNMNQLIGSNTMNEYIIDPNHRYHQKKISMGVNPLPSDMLKSLEHKKEIQLRA